MALEFTADLAVQLVVSGPALMPDTSEIDASEQAAADSAASAAASQSAAASSASSASSSASSASSSASSASASASAAAASAASIPSTPFSVANGGTGRASHTAYGPIVGGTTSTAAQQSAGAGTAGQVLASMGGSAVPQYETRTGPRVGMLNGTIAETRSSNAETIAIKTLAGTDPSATDPVYFIFQDGSGAFVVRSVTAALSLTISSGSTLGASNSTPFRVWWGAADDAGTVRLFAVNARSGTEIIAINDWSTYSSTAEGGAGAADSAQVLYSGTAFTSRRLCLIGFSDWDSGLATAGTWGTAPSRVILFGPGVARPGEPIQRRGNASAAVATGTTTIPYDDTIPQNTEGDQYFSQAVTPNSAANLLLIESQVWAASSATQRFGIALFQDSTANALLANSAFLDTVDTDRMLMLAHLMLAGTVSATTFKIRVGGSQAGTTTVNGSAAARKYGGVAGSYLRVTEIMG